MGLKQLPERRNFRQRIFHFFNAASHDKTPGRAHTGRRRAVIWTRQYYI